MARRLGCMNDVFHFGKRFVLKTIEEKIETSLVSLQRQLLKLKTERDMHRAYTRTDGDSPTVYVTIHRIEFHVGSYSRSRNTGKTK